MQSALLAALVVLSRGIHWRGAYRVFDGGDVIVIKGTASASVDSTNAAGEYPVSITVGASTVGLQAYRSVDGSIEELGMFFEITDPSYNDLDEIRVYFDVDHNHMSPAPGTTCPSALSPDRGLKVERKPGGVAAFTLVNTSGSSQVCNNIPAAQVALVPGAGGWKVEVKIKAADLNLNFIPSLMGMHIQVIDAGVGTARYPTGVLPTNVAQWANLKTRLPLNYGIVLDHSGSMLRDSNGNFPLVGPERWAAAKKATDIFAQLLYAFRPTEVGGTPYFTDRIGLATYYWDDAAASHDKTTKDKGMALVRNITEDGYSDNSPDPVTTPVFGQHTPIKRGVDTGFAMTGAESGTRIVILMSDGIHDRPADDYNAEPYVYPPGKGPADYQVNTVALGPDGSVGTELLQSISTAFGGFGQSYTV